MQAVQNGHFEHPARGRGGKSLPIVELYSHFEELHAKVQAALEHLDAAPHAAAAAHRDRVLSRICTKCHEAARRIVATPARSANEILLKLRVTAWAHADSEYRTLADLDHQMPTSIEEHAAGEVLASIQADLLRLTKGN